MAPRGPRGLLLLLFLHTATASSGWGGCLDAQDIFAAVRENSPTGEVIARLSTDVTDPGARLSLAGKDADWFFLEDGALRLNAAPEKILDREVQGPVLMAELACHEDDILQSVYRIMVEILNENDNVPVFAENTIQSVILSELTPVNTVVFTVHAVDGDDDSLIYSIDQESPDAEYLKLDLPNSGEIMLAKPLDYETKSLLTVTIQASEMSTAECFNTSTTVTITVVDGDDQYPQFLPCTLLFQDPFNRICISPVYTVNVTEGQEDIVLDLCPGPIHAVDGDSGLSSPISYAILSGGDDGRFQMDRQTGEVRLMQAVTDRLTKPTLHIRVMAYQEDDPRKYTVASVLVYVHAVNSFPPRFEQQEYQGFVNVATIPASLVNTYGNQVLMLRVLDGDFTHGSNPMIQFTFSPASNQTALYQITQEGLVIAKPNQLSAKQRHRLPVIAVDQESGDAAYTTIVVDVLPEGKPIPHGPLREGHLSGCVVGKALVLCFLFMVLLGCVLYVMAWLMKKHKGHRERCCVAQGKHPNVSLRWYQLMNQRGPLAQMEEVAFTDGDLGTYNPSFSPPAKPPGVFIHKDLPPCRGPAPLSSACPPGTILPPSPTASCSPPPVRCSSSGPVLHPPVASVNHSQMHPPSKSPPPEEREGSPTAPSPAGGGGIGAWADLEPTTPTTTTTSPGLMRPRDHRPPPPPRCHSWVRPHPVHHPAGLRPSPGSTLPRRRSRPCSTPLPHPVCPSDTPGAMASPPRARALLPDAVHHLPSLPTPPRRHTSGNPRATPGCDPPVSRHDRPPDGRRTLRLPGRSRGGRRGLGQPARPLHKLRGTRARLQGGGGRRRPPGRHGGRAEQRG
ncbi:cadherin-related family member 5 [Gadus macrocephalus]|uniref:cadherin-related family member 5 n=1 Tax=Gadus macrocephalus TaxID=80720 RepID=UPI0028CB2184|nr:cadherin-related family member 5 [Gadus macrocephalus]XP_059916098.1 cadherin-related family member 5 [Gadus macrocephalus]